MTTPPPDGLDDLRAALDRANDLDDLRALLEPREGDVLDTLRRALESMPDDGLTATLECARVASEARAASLGLAGFLDTIDRGDVEATPGERAYIAGAVDAFDRIAGMNARAGQDGDPARPTPPSSSVSTTPAGPDDTADEHDEGREVGDR